jgi:hypothetical protein
VLHLAQTEEGVWLTVSASDDLERAGSWRIEGETLDAAVERLVHAERPSPQVVFDRWRSARRAAVLRCAPPTRTGDCSGRRRRSLAGASFGDVFCELVAPDGSTWRFGDFAAPSSIRGLAGEFCRVGAQRRHPDDTTLVAEGPHGATALRVLRNYAA